MVPYADGLYVASFESYQDSLSNFVGDDRKNLLI